MFKYALPVLALAAAATPASAGNAAFLSHTGSSSTCTQGTPCSSMSTAITVAGDGGEVICLDKGNYGGLISITQSVTISCGDGLWEGFPGGITITTGPSSLVVIEGLVSDEAAQNFGTPNLLVNGQGTLHLRRVRVGNINNPQSGLSFTPNGSATLHITDSYFYNNGGSGVLIKPTSSATTNVHIRNSRFEHNLHGLFVDGTGGSGGIVVNMAESAAVDNRSNGIGAFTGSGNAVVSIINSQMSGNLNAGIGTLGTGPAIVSVRVGNSQITGNNWGVLNGGSGQILTLGGNHLHTNVNDGTFTGSIATK